MWKVFLAFVSHRALLVAVALAAAHFSSKPAVNTSVYRLLAEKVAEGPEVPVVESLSQKPFFQAMKETRNPFHWVAVSTTALFGIPAPIALLILSNIFLLLFLGQLVALFNRMVTSDIAVLGATFVVLWPTSYELSLGSSLSLVCFFLTLSVRMALEQKWGLAGVSLLGLALMDPIAMALVPLYGYLFWSVQRFLPAAQWGRNLGFFSGFFVLGCLLSGRSWGMVLGAVDQSAFFSLMQFRAPNGESLLSLSAVGQTLSLVFFFLGAAGALFSNVNPMHRFMPLLVLFALTLASPWGSLASRVPLAGACMEGIASASSGSASRIVSFLMLLLGSYEVYLLFSK
jgi:hypothetical protein